MEEIGRRFHGATLRPLSITGAGKIEKKKRSLRQQTLGVRVVCSEAEFRCVRWRLYLAALIWPLYTLWTCKFESSQKFPSKFVSMVVRRVRFAHCCLLCSILDTGSRYLPIVHGKNIKRHCGTTALFRICENTTDFSLANLLHTWSNNSISLWNACWHCIFSNSAQRLDERLWPKPCLWDYLVCWSWKSYSFATYGHLCEGIRTIGTVSRRISWPPDTYVIWSAA